jgi:ABC-type Mn2+/Zn2+ transport system permease subunit
MLELGLLSIAGGLLGAWIVLRRLAFFSHAVGAAAVPALVAAGPLGVSPQVAGLVAALGFTAGVEPAGRSGRDIGPSTGLLLVAALATAVVLASDVFPEAGAVDRLLFGGLLGVGPADLALSAVAAGLAIAATALLGRVWAATAFDRSLSRAFPFATRASDAALLGLVAVAAVAAVPAVGALLATSLFVAPAATARLVTSSVRSLIAASVVVAVAQSAAGLSLSLALDVAPGPAVAGAGALAYAVAATGPAVRRGRGRAASEAATA